MKKRLRSSTYQLSLSNDNAKMIVMAECLFLHILEIILTRTLDIEWILKVRPQELLMFLMSSLVVDVADAMELYVEEGVDDSSVTA